MYIPEQVLWFLLGFICFPIFAYALYEFWLKKKEIYDTDSKKRDPERQQASDNNKKI